MVFIGSATRKRSRVLVGGDGTEVHPHGGPTFHAITEYHSLYSEDVVGRVSETNPFFLERWDLMKCLFSGNFYSDDPTFFGYPTEGQPGPGHPVMQGIPSAATAVTSVSASSNPSKPTVSLPTELGELRELPKLMYEKLLDVRRQIKNDPNVFNISTARKGSHGENHVAWFNFGVLPIISDIQHLLNFSKELDSRVNLLKKLHVRGMLRGYKTILTDSFSAPNNGITVQSLYKLIQLNSNVKTMRKVWATCRWLPDDPQLGTSPSRYREQAALAIHGWQADPYSILSDAWELMPWSWFIDYFGNVGDYLNSQRNSIGAHSDHGCEMVHTITQTNYVKGPGNTISMRMGVGTYETKQRSISSATLDAHLPICSAGQVLTLVGIAANYSR